MSSNDLLRDVLDLPSGAVAPRPAKKQKTAGPRTKVSGLLREVQSLGGDNPIAIVPEVPNFKKRRLASRKPAARWELRPFKNSARDDGLLLKHWRRKPDHPTGSAGGDEQNAEQQELEDSTFAKFNVKVQVPEYTDEQYDAQLKNPDWTKEETDYLMNLVREYDLRWIVIWDRYEYTSPSSAPEPIDDSKTAVIPAPKPPRTMEHLKARYYDIAAKMMAIEKPVQFMGQAEFTLQELMANFDPAQERARKLFAENVLSRSAEDKKEEELLLLELKRIISRSERLSEERKELYARLSAPEANPSSISMYQSSAGLAQLVTQLVNADKDKKRKSLRGPEAMSPAVHPGSNASHAQSSGAYDDRRSSVATHGGHRESISGASAMGGGGSHSKKGSIAVPTHSSIRKLTADEERTYGVSHHDRLTGGATFRHERVNKLLQARSTAQSTKIANTLAELEIPARLLMPTQTVVQEFESLIGSVNSLLELKKNADKLDGEIKLAQNLKAERERKARARQEGGSSVAPTGSETGRVEGSVGAASSPQKGAEGGGNGSVMGGGDRDAGEEARGAGHKRSASVMSGVSDKSSKRQKK